MSRKTAEIVKSGALLLASLLVTALASELALRATGYRPTLADPAMYLANDHEYLPYRMRPHYEGFYMGQRVRLDGDGYRVVAPDGNGRPGGSGLIAGDATGHAGGQAGGSDTAAPDAGGQDSGPTTAAVDSHVQAGGLTAAAGPRLPRVLLLGDSVVFGHGLADEETPAAQLQRLFASNGRAVRVRNAGVSGYTTWNELAALEEYVATHEVDAVVLVYLENDITFDHNQLRVSDGTFGNIESSPLHRVTQAMYRHVYLSYLIRTGLESAKRLVSDRPAAASKASADRPAASSGPARSPLDGPAFVHSLEALSRMQALCEREGIGFTVGIYRDVTYYTEPERVLRYEARLDETLAARGIDSFVIGSHVEQLDRKSARLSWNDPHPTAEAVSLFVEDLRRAAAPLLDR